MKKFWMKCREYFKKHWTKEEITDQQYWEESVPYCSKAEVEAFCDFTPEEIDSMVSEVKHIAQLLKDGEISMPEL